MNNSKYKYSVLFICSANIGRSQMAEGFYNHYLKQMHYSGLKAASAAGIEDIRKKYDFRPAPEIIKVMAEKGIDISIQRVKLADKNLIAQSKNIIVLCEIKKCFGGIKKSSKCKMIPIKDPWSSKETSKKNRLKNYRRTRDKIEMIVNNLLSQNES